MNLQEDSAKVACKIWLEYDGKPVLGKGGAEILETIKKEESISKAAGKLGMSYRYVWNYLERMRKVLNEPVVTTFRGGKTGGGGAHLTELGERLLKEYHRMERYVGELLEERERWKTYALKVGAMNLLEGTVREVEKGEATTKVKVEVETPTLVTALISKEAAEKLNIKPGDHVKAVIEATAVMIRKEPSKQKTDS